MKQLFRVILCLAAVWLTLFFHIDENNELTELRRLIPEIEKDVKALNEENVRLQYEIDKFKSPDNLMQLARKPEYSHLKQTFANEIIVLPEPQYEGLRKHERKL